MVEVLRMEEEDGGSSPERQNNGGICKICLEITKWLPVLFILIVISWSYYAFAIQVCLFMITELWLKILTLIFYHTVLILFLWSYWQTIFCKSGRVPKKFKISQTDLDRVESAQTEQEVNEVLETIVRAQQLPIQTRTNISQIRYCEKCSVVKPDRTHHCSLCGRCILKMDHHCPWVNNCVCFDNYKFFVLFLVYAFLYCFVIFAFTMRYFIELWNRELNEKEPISAKFHVLFVFFVATMFAVSLVSLFGYHCYLITKNRSTLESFRSPIFRDGPDRKGFSLGSYYNFVEIFGEDKRKWFLPVFSSLGDGISFPTRQSQGTNLTGNYNSIDTTDASSTSPDIDRFVEVKVEAKTEDFNHTNDSDRAGTQNGVNHLQRISEPNGNISPAPIKDETPLVYF